MTCPSCLRADVSSCVTCFRGRCWHCLDEINVQGLYHTYYAPGYDFEHPFNYACASCLTEHVDGP